MHDSEKNKVSPEADGRINYDWETKYKDEAIKQMYKEGIYQIGLLIIAFLVMFYSIINIISYNSISSTVAVYKNIFDMQIWHCFLLMSSGLLGGIVFGMKYFYHAIAKGQWHQDRVAWRILSPLIAISMAFVVGLMVDSGIIKDLSNSNLLWRKHVIIGFLTGYFADDAARKLQEIAAVIFGQKKEKKD